MLEKGRGELETSLLWHGTDVSSFLSVFSHSYFCVVLDIFMPDVVRFYLCPLLSNYYNFCCGNHVICEWCGLIGT